MALCAGAAAHLGGALDRLELDTVDLRFSLRDEAPADDIVVVAVDDVTFSDLDLQWPFPRSLYGDAVDRLHAAGAREIVLDIQFTEQTNLREDLALYDAIDRGGGAVLATSETDGRGNTNVLGGDENLARVDSHAAAANLPEDSDGVIRHLEYSVGGLETIAVAVAERLDKPLPAADFENGGSWIDYRGGPETFRTISFSDLVRGHADPQAFAGKIVVLGASAPTLHDVHPTSTTGDALMSGPEVQANAIWTALRGLPLRSAAGHVDLLVILFFALVVPVVATRMRATIAALGALALAVAYAVAAKLAFDAGMVIALVAPLATLTLSTVLTVAASYLVEARERRRVALLNELLEERVRERTRELRQTQAEIVERLGKAVEWRDEETGDHVDRMSRMCYQLGLAAGLDRDQAELLRRASVMHDVGKIGVPDHILRKPGPLDADEWAIMKTHTTIGAGILAGSPSPLVQMAETIALTHHERWDGSGYPAGLAGEEIPLVGRICAVCDVFDALISNRPYKDPWPVNAALREIADSAGTHFDPLLADLFLELAPGLLDELGLDRFEVPVLA